MNKRPLLSVITIVLNNVNYIEKTIQNYLDQHCDESELVIIDGGSTDGTIDIIRNYGNLESKIRWISEKDKGQSDAMNKGLKLAEGEYVSFLNSDDYYNANALNTAIEIISQNKQIDFLVGNCNVWDEHNQLVYINKPLQPTTTNLLIGRYIPVNPAAYFYRKSIHNTVGGYNISNHYNMDIEFLLLASRVTKLKYVPIIFGNFRLLPEAKTGSDSIAGLLEERKQALFNLYLKKFGKLVELEVLFLKIKINVRSKLQSISAKIYDKMKFELTKITSKSKSK
jgi:glycosyltransferase involved in cell wall biosynthesis